MVELGMWCHSLVGYVGGGGVADRQSEWLNGRALDF